MPRGRGGLSLSQPRGEPPILRAGRPRQAELTGSRGSGGKGRQLTTASTYNGIHRTADMTASHEG